MIWSGFAKGGTMKIEIKHNAIYTPSCAKQNGAASLLMSIIILALITVVTLFTSKSILTEQKIANNDVRAKQAFEAAEAGLSAAITYLSENPDRDGDADNEVDDVFDTDGDGIGDSEEAMIGGTNLVVVTILEPKTDLDTIRIRAKGYSDDRKATRTIFRVVTVVDPIPNMPDNPMTTRGTVTVTGSATIFNPEGHSTIWSGDDINLGGNNSTATNVADMSDPNYPGCMDISVNNPGACGVVASSNMLIVGPDVIEYDTNLINLTEPQFFENFFGLPPYTYRDSMISKDVAAATVNADAHLAANEIIWVEGDTSFSGVTVGCLTTLVGAAVCAPTNTKPSIMIVNGDANFSGTNNFYGILFVMGAINITGSTNVVGALTAGSTINNSTGGALNIWYSSDLLRRARLNGPKGNASGSWADFCVQEPGQPDCLG